MKIIRCDRCGTEDDLFNREITVNSLYGGRAAIVDADHYVIHLCGYCTSQFRLLVAEPDEPEVASLRRWKAEALPLLELLERCHDLLPPVARATLGHSKAEAVERFLASRDPQGDAL